MGANLELALVEIELTPSEIKAHLDGLLASAFNKDVSAVHLIM